MRKERRTKYDIPTEKKKLLVEEKLIIEINTADKHANFKDACDIQTFYHPFTRYEVCPVPNL